MDPFLNLPDELLLQICSEMDVQTLSRITESNKYLNIVCSEILNKRKEIYELSNYDTFISNYKSDPGTIGSIIDIGGKIRRENRSKEIIIDDIIATKDFFEPGDEERFVYLPEFGIVGFLEFIEQYFTLIGMNPYQINNALSKAVSIDVLLRE